MIRSNPYKCTQGPYERFSLLIQLINVNTKERKKKKKDSEKRINSYA